MEYSYFCAGKCEAFTGRGSSGFFGLVLGICLKVEDTMVNF